MPAKIINCCSNAYACKNSPINILLLIAAFFISACEKTEYPANPATVQIFNALDDGDGLYAGLSGSTPAQFNTSLTIANKSYLFRNNVVYSSQSPQPLAFYALKDTLPKDKPVLDAMLDLVPGAIYSVFIYGTKTSARYFLNTDQIPAINRNDSTTHLRVVNLSEGQELSVNIKGQPHKSFIDKLDFKELSSFIELSTSKSIARFEFEFRDYTTGDVITDFAGDNTYTNESRFYAKSNTLVFAGKKGGTGTNQQKVILMNHR